MLPENTNVQTKQMTLLKKQLSQCSPAAKRALNNFLSTIYGHSMVAQGYAALLEEGLSQLPSTVPSRLTNQYQAKIKTLYIQSSLLLEEIQDLSERTGEIEYLLEDEIPSSRN